MKNNYHGTNQKRENRFLTNQKAIPMSDIDGVKLSAKFQICKSFIQSRGKVFRLEPHFEATRNFSGPKKIPRAYFGLLNLCNKIYPKILRRNKPKYCKIFHYIYVFLNRIHSTPSTSSFNKNATRYVKNLYIIDINSLIC